MALSLEERKYIKDSFPHGTQARIAERLGVTRASVQLYLTGKRSSELIENAVLDEFDRVKAERKRLRERIFSE